MVTDAGGQGEEEEEEAGLVWVWQAAGLGTCSWGPRMSSETVRGGGIVQSRTQHNRGGLSGIRPTGGTEVGLRSRDAVSSECRPEL